MDRKTITSELRAQFFPLLQATGFVRQGDIARRVLDGSVVHIVEIQHRPRSAVFQVNLGAHLLALGDVAGGTLPAPQTMRDHDCAWRGSVIAGFRNATDAELAYGASAHEAAESVAFLVSEWQRQSQAFFAPFSDYPARFWPPPGRLRRTGSGTPPTCSPGPGSPRCWVRLHWLSPSPRQRCPGCRSALLRCVRSWRLFWRVELCNDGASAAVAQHGSSVMHFAQAVRSVLQAMEYGR